MVRRFVVVATQPHMFKKCALPLVHKAKNMSKNGPRCGEKIEPVPKPGAPSSMDVPLSGPKPDEVRCPECGKAFTTKSQMERHRENSHHHEF
jgi:uncharacterized protein with PIN domain